MTDVDGVLTDGRLYHCVDTRGQLVELKGVDTQDGIALAWLAQAGISTGVISGRISKGFSERARVLHMKHIIQGTVEKVPALEKILRKEKIQPEEAAFIGDDLTDIPVMRRVGWAVAPANARPEVKRAADTVTRARGGQGAVREAVEKLLKAQGRWAKILKHYEA